MAFVLTSYIHPVLVVIHTLDPVDALGRLLLPLAGFVIMGFFLVFEAWLNMLAELTYFGDRSFYEDFWNSSTFMEFR